MSIELLHIIKNVRCKILFCVLLIFTTTAFANESQETCSSESSIVTLDLETSINLAIRAEKTIGSALYAVDQTKNNLELADADFTLRVVPRGDMGYIGGGKAGEGVTLGIGADIAKKFTHGTVITLTPSQMKAAHNYQSNIRVVISQPLLRGFGTEYTMAGVYGAMYANRTAIRNLYQAKIQLILQTIQNLYEISKQEHMVFLHEQSLQRIKKFHKSTKLKQKMGFGDAIDIYRAERELKHAEDNLAQSQDNFQESKDNLRELLGLPLDYPFKVIVPIEYDATEIPFEEAVQVALHNRIEIDLAEDQASEARRLQKIAKQNLKPELNLVLDYTSYGYDEVLTSSWTGKRENKWGVGFTTTNDFNNAALKMAYEQSSRDAKDAEIFIDDTRNNISLEVKRGLRFLKRASQRIFLHQEQIEAALKEYKFANLKFEHGKANNFDLIQAENNLRKAQGALLAAVIDHKVGEYKFLATLGTLADKPKDFR